MPSSIPDVPTLLEAAVAYLEGELLPTLDGYHRFQTRVLINVLRTARRELVEGPALDAESQAELQALLPGVAGDRKALEAELAARLTDGRVPTDDQAMLAHVRHATESALAVNNPKWLRRG